MAQGGGGTSRFLSDFFFHCSGGITPKEIVFSTCFKLLEVRRQFLEYSTTIPTLKRGQWKILAVRRKQVFLHAMCWLGLTQFGGENNDECLID